MFYKSENSFLYKGHKVTIRKHIAGLDHDSPLHDYNRNKLGLCKKARASSLKDRFTYDISLTPFALVFDNRDTFLDVFAHDSRDVNAAKKRAKKLLLAYNQYTNGNVYSWELHGNIRHASFRPVYMTAKQGESHILKLCDHLIKEYA